MDAPVFHHAFLRIFTKVTVPMQYYSFIQVLVEYIIEHILEKASAQDGHSNHNMHNTYIKR